MQGGNTDMTLPWLNMSEDTLFTRHLPEELSTLLRQSAYASSYDDKRAEKMLWQAQQMHPEQLELYVVIYKFYLFNGRLAEAHQTLRQAMIAAAEVGDFPADWKVINSNSTNWCATDMPHRLYLYCLRELALLLQRMRSVDESYEVVQKLYEIDCSDISSNSIMQILNRNNI